MRDVKGVIWHYLDDSRDQTVPLAKSFQNKDKRLSVANNFAIQASPAM
jgi:hypothetical protein